MTASGLASYATSDDAHGGRDHKEEQSTLFRPFELDRHRIMASTAFRRLEGKTQVFAPALHDHFRTRLTHTLEVAHVARCLARMLRCHAELTEAIVLAHDVGHAPFGHAGEAALNDCMSRHGGFNHNLHSLRVVEYLEHPIPAFRGLNLTRATRDGLRTHETRYDAPDAPAEHVAGVDMAHASVEAQIASLADRIAYDCHDLEDALGAGLLSADALGTVGLWSRAHAATGALNAKGSLLAVRRVILDGLLHILLSDALSASSLADRQPIGSGSSFRPHPAKAAPATVPRKVRLSDVIAAELNALEEFLAETVYQNKQLARTDATSRAMIAALFDRLTSAPHLMPERFARRIDEQGAYRVTCDYIAGMTDRYCRAAYERYVGT